MNQESFIAFLNGSRIPDSAVSIFEGDKDEAVVLEDRDGVFSVYYFERGHRRVLRKFETASHAFDYARELLEAEIEIFQKYP